MCEEYVFGEYTFGEYWKKLSTAMVTMQKYTDDHTL